MKILRVFPRRTKATPDDCMAFIGEPPLFRPPADEVHVSVTFTWDCERAFRLRDSWARYYPVVKIGGPALNTGMDTLGFEPGMYLRDGYVITTRGCPNHCPWCFVPKREGELRCLPIRKGYDVLDNNLLAAPEKHIRAVLRMLREQPHPARFSGGLEATRVTDWFVHELSMMRVHRLFLAYDRPEDKEPVLEAIGKFKAAGFQRVKLCCYVLVAYQGDTQDAAERRCRTIVEAGATPFAMFFRGPDSPAAIDPDWRAFVREWTRPAAIFRRQVT